MEATRISPVFVAYRIAAKERIIKDRVDGVRNRILMCKTFSINKIVGSFFSCIYNGQLRIHAVFNEETNMFNKEIVKFINRSMAESGMNCGMIWVRAANKSIIAQLNDKFILTPDSEQFFYHSTEYIMRRDRFNKTFDNSILYVRPYEEIHIDKYLELLNDSMSFFVPPHDFVDEKERYIKEFTQFQEKNAFEAFWKDGDLIGLYWIVGSEVDTIGVSAGHQRLGYGSMILTRAIETIFHQNPGIEYAVLYAVGWNSKAQNFYQKYGMEISSEHLVPYIDNNS